VICKLFKYILIIIENILNSGLIPVTNSCRHHGGGDSENAQPTAKGGIK